jgi:acetyl esterase/lipase
VPFGYLTSTVLIATATVLTLAPVRRPRLLAGFGFRAGIVVGELPFVVMAMLAGSTALAFAEGDVDSPGAWAIVGLAGLTVGGLAIVAARGLLAGPAVERALDEGLGAGWRAEAPSGLVSRLRRRRLPSARTVVAPFPLWSGHDVVRIRNVSYGDAGRRNLLDVYRRRGCPGGAPVLVYVHGGHFRGGGKSREARPLLHRLASRGWVCVSANYRLTPPARFPDHLVDLKRAIAWAREHGPEHGADPATLFVAGSSAGAHMAAMAALTPNDPAFQPGFEAADTAVSAAVCLYGYYGRMSSDGPLPSSPFDHVAAGAPPFFLAHGDRDTVTSVERARELAERLRAASPGPVVYAELPGAQHSFDLFRSPRFERVVDGVEAFAASVRVGPR